ncbi:DNA primase [Sporosarcina sp. resist]|uniref:DNA primase n=1 Tax=Sporosarcina sp. resist TaxID=2762563 RepID=UPI00164EAD0A|nr:DNA primase [Sporosarcina sp. resist]QNK86620.1 DNA primase [Sporosarcina sp. resist]
MDLKLKGEKKWLKLGAATLLSVGMLAACGDGDDDDVDVDVNEPVEDVNPEDGTNRDVDLDTDDETDKDVEVDDDGVVDDKKDDDHIEDGSDG